MNLLGYTPECAKPGSPLPAPMLCIGWCALTDGIFHAAGAPVPAVLLFNTSSVQLEGAPDHRSQKLGKLR